MKITNLDKLNVENQVVVLDGKEWIIPGEISVNTIFKLMELNNKMKDNPDDLKIWEDQYRIIHEIFNINHPDLKIDDLKKLLTARQIGVLLGVFTNSIGQVSLDNPEEKKIIKEALVQNDDTSV